MGFRFRKSINLGAGVKVNVSKKGLGVSAGVKGFRVSHGADGKTRVTASLPGTGISFQETIKTTSNTKPTEAINVISQVDRDSIGWKETDYFASFHGQLEMFYEDGERDSYYEKYANVYIYKDRIEVTYSDPNTAAFAMIHLKYVKLYKIVEERGFLFFKKSVTKLRIKDETLSFDPEYPLSFQKDITFILKDEKTADDIILSYNKNIC